MGNIFHLDHYSFIIYLLHNVSLEATWDAARFADQGAGVRIGNSWPMVWPRRLSSRVLGGKFATVCDLQGLIRGEIIQKGDTTCRIEHC